MIYNLNLKIFDKDYKGKGETIDLALGSMDLDWQTVKGKGVLTIKQGKKSIDKFFYYKQLKRIFANKLTRQLWGRNLERLFLASK
jgi:hypothetical protein